MIMALDQRVTTAMQAEESRLRMFADQMQKLLEGLEAMRVAGEIHDERKAKELRLLESSVTLDLNAARQARRDMEARVEQLGDQRMADLREEGLRQLVPRNGGERTDHLQKIGEEVSRFTVHVEEQRSSRVKYGERILDSLSEEFAKVQEAILAEQKLRFDAESGILQMVEDMATRLRGELGEERGEREAVQGRLLTLLEDTCTRVESSVGTSWRAAS